MFNNLEKLRDDFSDNPFISFDSDGHGVSRIFDDKWDFASRRESIRYVYFSSIPLAHKKNIQTFMAKLIGFHIAKAIDNHISVSKMTRMKSVLFMISKFWNKSDYSLLSSDVEWECLKEALKGKVSLPTLKNIITIFNELSRAGLLDRHVKSEEFINLANDKKKKQHIALPTTIHAHLLQKAMEVINIYHPYRFDISSVMKASISYYDDEYPKELNKRCLLKLDENGIKNLNLRVVKYANKLGENIPDFNFYIGGGWVNKIVKYCLMIVAMFTGMRRSELRATSPNSYKLISGIPVLIGNTYKGNKGVAKREVWVTHPIALKALELAYDATMYAREHFKGILDKKFDDNLINKDVYSRGVDELSSSFIKNNMQSHKYNNLQDDFLLRTYKNIFSLESFEIKATNEEVNEFNLLNPDWIGELKVGGTLPKLSLHDLRRSFSVFMIRNKLGNLQTLKYQLKHKNVNMSDWYANNAELARIEGLLIDNELMDEVNNAMQTLAVEAFDDIYNGTKHLSGGGSSRVIEEREKALGRGETIVLSRNELESLVKNGTKSIVLLPTGGYCTNSSCERLCSIDTFAVENKPCQHLIITDKGAKQMAVQRKRLIEAFESINEMDDYAYSRILVGYSVRIRQIEHTLKVHNIFFDPFTLSIKALS